jgi:hypothetical protein
VTFHEATMARLLIYFLSYVLALPVGHFVVRRVVLGKYQLTEREGPNRAGGTIGCLERLLTAVLVLLGEYEPLAEKYLPREAGGFEGAGRAIGYLERLLTLTFVLLGEYEALALILAAKSIARFQELKERKFAEYYLIGTLSSITFAMLVGIFTSWLISLL